MAIGEFTDVGETINEFVSDRGLVVVGTVIDPEATEELRVTVVATGLGDSDRPPNIIVDNTSERLDPVELDRDDPWAGLDQPTVMRKKASIDSNKEPGDFNESDSDSSSADYLDIPAFLRRQAD